MSALHCCQPFPSSLCQWKSCGCVDLNVCQELLPQVSRVGDGVLLQCELSAVKSVKAAVQQPAMEERKGLVELSGEDIEVVHQQWASDG